uniref:Uncharacterized protein n=1 Tax=Arundo donax TaxID=35708 RepID=A0A0A9DA02_ARUDO
MYHLPLKSAKLKFLTRADASGTGNSPTSDFFGTHFLRETAHSLNSSTTLFSNRSPHLIWHSVSSGRLLHVCKHAMFAAQEGLDMHLASSILHSFSRQVQVLRASTASAEGTTRIAHAIIPVMVTNCSLLHFLMVLKTSDACSTAIISDRVTLTRKRSVQKLALTQHRLNPTAPWLLVALPLDFGP